MPAKLRPHIYIWNIQADLKMEIITKHPHSGKIFHNRDKYSIKSLYINLNTSTLLFWHRFGNTYYVEIYTLLRQTVQYENYIYPDRISISVNTCNQ